eukprot:4802504-Prymnesium_polylepis.1
MVLPAVTEDLSAAWAAAEQLAARAAPAAAPALRRRVLPPGRAAMCARRQAGQVVPLPTPVPGRVRPAPRVCL